jgi:tRNA threonylcarbamoyladenosine biosynthesis protein TsaB
VVVALCLRISIFNNGCPIKTIAIDSSGPIASVAVFHGDTLFEASLDSPRQHASLLTPLLSATVKKAGWRMADTELVVVVRGPGSFTGLRVGIATAKAIAWSCGARIVGVSSTEVVAEMQKHLLPLENSLEVVFDAGRGELFVASAEASASTPSPWRVSRQMLVNPAAWLQTLSPGTCISGPACDIVSCRPDFRADLRCLKLDTTILRATIAARLGLLIAAKLDPQEDPLVECEYMRETYADEKLEPAKANRKP